MLRPRGGHGDAELAEAQHTHAHHFHAQKVRLPTVAGAVLIVMTCFSLSAHLFRYLVDQYRTPEAPYSALTGLKAKSHFGRPDLSRIFDSFYTDMKNERFKGQVGVFFCGASQMAREIVDRLKVVNAKAQSEDSKIQFVFQNEVF
jgi:hypothetical protein